MPTYIIEHLEPEIGEWCLIEYREISKIVGKENLWFTNIKKDENKLAKYGKVFEDSVRNFKLKNACVLDPEAKKLLYPKEAKKFDYFIIGGILGDNPPRKRTKAELTRFLKLPKRNIGEAQFSTDNAVYVVSQIAKGKPFTKMKFKDEIEIRINEIESVILPYRYPLINNKPRISKELIQYLKTH